MAKVTKVREKLKRSEVKESCMERMQWWAKNKIKRKKWHQRKKNDKDNDKDKKTKDRITKE